MIVILTGPESTGKTWLSEQLARHFEGIFIPEYARSYIAGLKRKYTYNDIEKIAFKQIKQMESIKKREVAHVFFDTYLIITKVWFIHVYKKYPIWIDQALAETKDALYLLCKPDIEWQPDMLRENGGVMRDKLYETYEHELRKSGLNYSYVEGINDNRLSCAIIKIKDYFNM